MDPANIRHHPGIGYLRVSKVLWISRSRKDLFFVTSLPIACPARPSFGPRLDDRAPPNLVAHFIIPFFTRVYFQVSLHLVTRVSLAQGSVVICNTAFEYKGSTGNLSLAAIQTWVAAAYRKSCAYFLALTGVTQRSGCS